MTVEVWALAEAGERWVGVECGAPGQWENSAVSRISSAL